MRERPFADRMAGRTALITGASFRHGRATALLLADVGARVALVALPGSGLDVVAELCAQRGVGIATVEADVSDPAQVERAFDRGGELGRPDAVFSAAGTSTGVSAIEPSDEVWNRPLRVNLTRTLTWSAPRRDAWPGAGGGRSSPPRLSWRSSDRLGTSHTRLRREECSR